MIAHLNSFQLSRNSSISSGKWLIFLDTVTSLEDFFTYIHVPLDCKFLVAQNSNVEGEEYVEVAFTEVYRVRPSLPLQKHRVGNWSSSTGVVWSAVPFYERRKDLQGITINAALTEDVSILLKFYIKTPQNAQSIGAKRYNIY